MAQKRLEDNRVYTADEFMEIAGSSPDMELTDGRLTPVRAAAWNTSKLTARLISYLTVYAESRDLGSVWGIDGSFRIDRDPETVLMPDVAFLLPHRMEDVILDTFFEGSPDLAVEVRSPSDRMADLSKKMDRYLDAGTEMTWRTWTHPGVGSTSATAAIRSRRSSVVTMSFVASRSCPVLPCLCRSCSRSSLVQGSIWSCPGRELIAADTPLRTSPERGILVSANRGGR